MPTYRPDYFGQKQSKTGKVEQQVVVEVEIESTVFCRRTEKQILLMDEFLRQQQRKRVKAAEAAGILALPEKSKAKMHASALLSSLFPEGHSIQLLELAV
jgi:hypothetical protein